MKCIDCGPVIYDGGGFEECAFCEEIRYELKTEEMLEDSSHE